MNRELTKALKEANKELRDQKHFQNYQITVDGNFTSEYNEVRLENSRGHIFPIANAETEKEAVAAIKGYMAGLGHGKDNSYPKICDKDNY